MGSIRCKGIVLKSQHPLKLLFWRAVVCTSFILWNAYHSIHIIVFRWMLRFLSNYYYIIVIINTLLENICVALNVKLWVVIYVRYIWKKLTFPKMSPTMHYVVTTTWYFIHLIFEGPFVNDTTCSSVPWGKLNFSPYKTYIHILTKK